MQIVLSAKAEQSICNGFTCIVKVSFSKIIDDIKLSINAEKPKLMSNNKINGIGIEF